MRLRKASFKRRCCIAGELHAPCGITTHSYKPHGVQMAVFSISGSCIRVWKKASVRSSLAKTRLWAARWRMSSIIGTGVQSLIIMLLRPRKSQRNRNFPFSFLIRNAGAAQGELEG
ncbi:hypothetical protein C364_01179 [Cryptococcus neoformans Bt63]|nr:hypothetical protein C364_01179 [Cryptococcus neoformans var. grubii Bt63]